MISFWREPALWPIDYLPLSIAWNCCRQTSILVVGARSTVEGRIQSRTYTKNLRPPGASGL